MMDYIDKLYKKSSHLNGDKQSRYISCVNEYSRMKNDLEVIRTPIESSNIKEDLYNAHLAVENESDPDKRKQAFIDSIRLYIKFITSDEGEKYKTYIKNILDNRYLVDVYQRIMGVASYTNQDTNMIVGLIRSYYDVSNMLLDSNISTSLLDREDFWAYENLEKEFLDSDIDNMDNEAIMKILNTSKSATFSYIISLYDSSKIVNKLLQIEFFINSLERQLDGPEVLNKKVANFMMTLKKGNTAIAFENHKKQRLITMKSELRNFNSLILNLNRR